MNRESQFLEKYIDTMTKTMLRKEAGITTAALAKLGKNENVNTEVLVKICSVLKCDISDIMELTDERTKE